MACIRSRHVIKVGNVVVSLFRFQSFILDLLFQKVLNLMQSDASTIENTAIQVHTLWDGPLQISIYTYLLFQYLGSSVAWGLAVLLTVIPVNSVVLRISDRLSRRENEARSARTKRTNESITHMKLLKLQKIIRL